MIYNSFIHTLCVVLIYVHIMLNILISKQISVTIALTLEIVHMMKRLYGRHESKGYGLNDEVRNQWNKVRHFIHVKIVMLSISI